MINNLFRKAKQLTSTLLLGFLLIPIANAVEPQDSTMMAPPSVVPNKTAYLLYSFERIDPGSAQNVGAPPRNAGSTPQACPPGYNPNVAAIPLDSPNFSNQCAWQNFALTAWPISNAQGTYDVLYYQHVQLEDNGSSCRDYNWEARIIFKALVYCIPW